MEADSFVGVIGKRTMGVTEVAVVDFLAPCGEDVIEVMRDAGDRGGLREVALVEAEREARDIGHLIECAWDVSLATVVQPGFAVTDEGRLIHVAVRAIAVKEELAVQKEPVLVTGQHRTLEAQFGKAATEGAEAVMVSQNIVDGAALEFVHQPVEPFQRGLEGGGFIRQAGPAEVEDIAIEHQNLGACHLFPKGSHPFKTLRARGKQVEVGNDEAGFHVRETVVMDESGWIPEPQASMAFCEVGAGRCRFFRSPPRSD